MHIQPATEWHITKFSQAMTETEKGGFNQRYRIGFASYLRGMMAAPSDCYVMMAKNNVAVAAFSVDPSGRLSVFCHPSCYHSDADLATAVLPIYRNWLSQIGELDALPIHWDKNVLRWFDELGFYEPAINVMIYNRPFEPRRLVPGPEIGGSKNPIKISA